MKGRAPPEHVLKKKKERNKKKKEIMAELVFGREKNHISYTIHA